MGSVPAAATAAALPLLWKGLVAAAGGAATNGLVGAVEGTRTPQTINDVTCVFLATTTGLCPVLPLLNYRGV